MSPCGHKSESQVDLTEVIKLNQGATARTRQVALWVMYLLLVTKY